jgi:hypothetical protein
MPLRGTLLLAVVRWSDPPDAEDWAAVRPAGGKEKP